MTDVAEEKEQSAVRILSFRPHHPRAAVAFGLMVGLIGAAITESGPASATNAPAAQPMAGMVTETAAVLVPAKGTPLPDGPIAADAHPDVITELQTRLQWVASFKAAPTGVFGPETTAALKHFQEKHQLKRTGNADEKTVARLNDVASDTTIDARCLRKGVTLCVDKTAKLTRYVKDGTVVRQFDTNFGPEKGDPKFGQYSSTREGVNPIRSKSRLSISTSYGYAMPYWMGFDGGIGFHYSAYFDQTGYADTSMGCTILRSESEARWLFNNTPRTAKVVVYS